MNNNSSPNNFSNNPTHNTDSTNQTLNQELEDWYNNFVISPESQETLSINQYYSEEDRRPRSWDQRERQRFEVEQLERRNIRELRSGHNHFLGIEPNHPILERYRYQAERFFPPNPVKYFRSFHPQDPGISTTITL